MDTLNLNKSLSKSYRTLALLLGGWLALTGCSSTSSHGAQRNQFVTTFYAHVVDITPIKFESYAGEVALYGGLEGAMFNLGEDDMLFSALFSAAITGMVVSVLEGDRHGLEVGLQAVDGDYIVVTSEQDDLIKGECVRVRVDNEVHIRKVQAHYCEVTEI